jgi:PiT family inorganic phosphate transporter
MMQLMALTDLANQAMAKSVEPSGAITTGSIVLLCLAVGMALAFEFVNGFHDTANAVATVIYTHSLPPWIAVVWSGLMNLTGVLIAGSGVAFGVLALLPVEMVLNVGSSAGFAMVFALLLSAIIWNLGTWYMGLPASSTHSLFGAIIGVGLGNAMLSAGHSFGDGVNWGKLKETLLALLTSPIIGFVFSGLLLLLSKLLLRWPALYKAPEGEQPPPWPIRALLILTCTSVSLGHGSNDGQKGMGLVLLILIGILPGVYALNSNVTTGEISNLHNTAAQVQRELVKSVPSGTLPPKDPSLVMSAYLKSSGIYNDQLMPALIVTNQKIIDGFNGKSRVSDLPVDQRSTLRQNIYEASGVLTKLEAQKKITNPALLKLIDAEKTGYKAQLDHTTKFIPLWVKLATACALGFGTMIGWKRIVITVGEKIGKTHLTYAQGASAELVAAATILVADHFKLPVSTTHILSSGVAGTMAANKSGLQMQTLRNIVLAWVLTLPVCTLLGAALFAAGLVVVLHNLVMVAIGVLTVGALIAAGIFVWRLRAGGNRQSPLPNAV